MFGISGIELAIIVIFAFLVFGPDKLPGVIKNVTHIWNVLKGLRQQADQVIKAEVVEPLKDIEATVNPFVEEGKSATETLAKKLGIKPDPPKKDEKKTDGEKSKDTEEKAAEAQNEAAETSSADSDSVQAVAVAATTKAATSSEMIETALEEAKETTKPKTKPKTESFAEKKAALERAHREQQQAEKDSTEAAAAPPETSTESSITDETAGG